MPMPCKKNFGTGKNSTNANHEQDVHWHDTDQQHLRLRPAVGTSHERRNSRLGKKAIGKPCECELESSLIQSCVDPAAAQAMRENAEAHMSRLDARLDVRAPMSTIKTGTSCEFS
jgi:hypothetical protein